MRPNRSLDLQMEALGYVSVPEASMRTAIPRTTLYDAIRQERVAMTLVRSRRYLLVTSLLAFGGPAAEARWKETQPTAARGVHAPAR